MIFTGPAPDRQAIAELNAAYGHATSSHDLSLFRSLWMPDAVWTHPYFGRLDGVDAIAEIVEEAFGTYPLLVFMSQLGTLAVEEDGASGSVYVSELTGTADGRKARVTGRYDDHYARIGKGWRFARRDYHIFDVSPVPAAVE